MGDRSEGRPSFPSSPFSSRKDSNWLDEVIDSWFLVGAKEEENEFVALPVSGTVTEAAQCAHEASEETEEVKEMVTVKPTVAALTESEIKEVRKEETEEEKEEEKEAEKIRKPPVTDVAEAAGKEGDEKETGTEKIIKLPTTTATDAQVKEVRIQIIPETELGEALPRVNYREENPMRRTKKIRGSSSSSSSKSKKKKKPILNRNGFEIAFVSMLFVFVLLWFTILVTSRLHGRSLNFDEESKSHLMLQQQWPWHRP